MLHCDIFVYRPLRCLKSNRNEEYTTSPMCWKELDLSRKETKTALNGCQFISLFLNCNVCTSLCKFNVLLIFHPQCSTYTHIHCFKSHFPGKPRWASSPLNSQYHTK